MIRTKRVYEAVAPDDGRRVLIDRLWPRGLSKAAAHVDAWEKALAPSPQLRQWYGHDPAKFNEFRKRYRAELEGQQESLRRLAAEGREGPVTLLFGARDGRYCNATVLKELLDEMATAHPSARPRPLPR